MALAESIGSEFTLRLALPSEGWTNYFGTGPPYELVTYAVYWESWLVDQRYWSLNSKLAVWFQMPREVHENCRFLELTRNMWRKVNCERSLLSFWSSPLQIRPPIRVTSLSLLCLALSSWFLLQTCCPSCSEAICFDNLTLSCLWRVARGKSLGNCLSFLQLSFHISEKSA